ncbi:hypothetical protein L0B53_14370 [Vibrio sp. SS-MA-C1-2]|uniref:TPR domain-containing protein n=1 Tax=Vibrio sp. SS-MA-C1-2 TaxID=2908646 RepID=UPI001F3F1B7D|nr:hypothetical protein [Vibrio sp. SS-MA-C1-2]UJF18194.1 hypothetical protein L0B53_14370 [Vibrio sp. SS-MA-C1-2]
MPFLIIAIISLLIVILAIFIHDKKHFKNTQFVSTKANSQRPLILMVTAVLTLITTLYFVINAFHQPLINKSQQQIEQDSQVVTYESQMTSLQDKLREDTNNSELWFQLGEGYLIKNELENALQCFNYSIRLSNDVSANQLAAKATVLYYLSKQSMTDEVTALLTASLNIDPYNQAALTLLANDKFVEFKYQQAIDLWQKVLDSERTDVDRVTIINSINKAKQLMNNKSK